MAGRQVTPWAPGYWSKAPTGREKGAQFHIDFKGDVGKMLARAGERLNNYRPLLDLVGRQVVGLSKRSFVRQASPETNDPWEPLKRPRGKGHNQGSLVLFDTGSLYRSIRHQIVAGNAVWIGWTPAYGIYHQSPEPRTSTLPRRQFVGAPPSEVPRSVRAWVQQCFAITREDRTSSEEGG